MGFNLKKFFKKDSKSKKEKKDSIPIIRKKRQTILSKDEVMELILMEEAIENMVDHRNSFDRVCELTIVIWRFWKCLGDNIDNDGCGE